MMNNSRKIILALWSLFIFMSITSCVPGGGHYNPAVPAGFFSGVWHGWIAPFTLVFSFFDSSLTIYEPFNTGWWYNFGFYISIISGFGGVQLFRRKDSKRSK